MSSRSILTLLILGVSISFWAANKKGVAMYNPPEKKPHRLEFHGDVRVDDYFWMRERDSKPVMDYLRQENRRVAEMMAPVKDLEQKVYREMRSRIKENDASVPVYDTGYFYFSRYQTGQEYPLHCRKKGSLEAKEEIILDENEEAKGQSYYDVGAAQVSPNHQLLAFAADTVGRRIYTIEFKDLETGRKLKDRIEAVTPDFIWAADNKTVFFVKQDAETLRSFQVYRYEIGQSGAPELIFEEKDTTFNVGLEASRDGNHLYMVSAKRDSSETWILDAHQPRGKWEVFLPREKNHEYSLEDGGDRVYILTNWQAKNFRLMEAPFSARSKTEWKEVIAHDPKILREGVSVFRSHFIVSERSGGLTHLRVVDRKTGAQRQVKFDEPAYEVEINELPDYDSPKLRFEYESYVQPPAVYDEDFAAQTRTLMKEKEVPGYKKELYESRRIWAKAADGAEIPVTLLLKKGTPLDGKNPALIYGYGSYGLSMPVQFWSSMFSLVDRGFVLAVPHIRGGQEMGRDWYEKGRLHFKMNTFTDFIAATEKLIADGYTAKEHTHIMGGSAGGLLMGAVMNLRPELYRSVTAQVPFVDVLTTMLDESIPLTTGEYNEWGDPRKKEDYEYMKKYSPYDNVTRKAYPAVFVQTGYHDSQVQYWEPAKWVAKLRELKTDNNPLLFYTELEAGHSGASGRFEALKTLAKQYAFILMLEGVRE